MKGYYMNKKTCTLYFVLGTVRDCTNATDGRVMVEYVHANDAEECKQKYVRDFEEFNVKFKFFEKE